MTQRLSRRVTIWFATLFSLLFVVVGTVTPWGTGMLLGNESAQAADASAFDPGDIISDQNFFNGYALDANEVQAFLNARVPVCDPGYTCLKDKFVNTFAFDAAEGRCEAFPGGLMSAAQIITTVGQICGISQKVLLVLLEKESSLVTDTWPMSWQYRSATGYACPDTAQCDAIYKGFFKQVYWAARQFKAYALWPNDYNHQPGEGIKVLFNPDQENCSYSFVDIQNQATAGLYNYTPYQPNAAALANLYGLGDECSAYGNRNFWRIYTDWFGDPRLSSDLVHASGANRVFLITKSKKYLVTNPALANAFSPLGYVTPISASYLRTLTNSGELGRIVRGPGGNIWFIDQKQRVFMSCEVVQAFGKSCDGSDVPLLERDQILKFPRSAYSMTSRVKLTTGVEYIMRAGTKKEIFDASSVTIPEEVSTATTLVGKTALDGFPLGPPLIRDGVITHSAGMNTYGLYLGATYYAITAAQATQSALANAYPLGDLQSASVQQMSTAPALTTGFWTTGDGIVYVLTTQGLTQVPVSSVPATIVSTAPAELVSALTQTQTGVLGFAAKTVSGAKTFLIINGKKKPFASQDQITRALASGQIGNTVLTVPNGALGALPLGTPLGDASKIFTPLVP